MSSHPDIVPARPFPFVRFGLSIGGQTALILALEYWIAPEVIAAELARPWAVVGLTLALGLHFSLFEYLFHRYLLHSSVLPFLGVMHDAHAEHHGLTNVKAPVTPKHPERMVPVDSWYPVEELHQEQSMKFPMWSFAIFLAVFMLVLGLPGKLLFPTAPFIVATTFGVMAYYSAYELWHAVLHFSFDEKWLPLMRHPRLGPVVKHVYGFHLMHHWRPTANLAVVGLWGIAFWDHLFRTHHRPKNLPLDGSMVNYVDAAMPKPRWPVSRIDRIQPAMYKGSRRIERALIAAWSRIFSPRSQTR